MPLESLLTAALPSRSRLSSRSRSMKGGAIALFLLSCGGGLVPHSVNAVEISKAVEISRAVETSRAAEASDTTILEPVSPVTLIQANRNKRNANPGPWKTPKQGLPGSREDGGTRASASGMTVFASASGVVPLAAEAPSLMVHLDDSMASRTLNLLVMDEAGEVLYDKNFKVAGETGTFRMDLPEEDMRQVMRPNEDYIWSLAAQPEDARLLDLGSAENPSLSGRMRRLAPGEGSTLDADLAASLAQASPIQKARLLYEELGHWHECATVISKILEDPNASAEEIEKANRAWAQSMKLGGHEELAEDMPIPSPLVELALDSFGGLF